MVTNLITLYLSNTIIPITDIITNYEVLCFLVHVQNVLYFN